jgi:hypothetical protein
MLLGHLGMMLFQYLEGSISMTHTVTLPAVSCDAPPTLSYTTLDLASRVLLSSKKSAICIAQHTMYTATRP